MSTHPPVTEPTAREPRDRHPIGTSGVVGPAGAAPVAPAGADPAPPRAWPLVARREVAVKLRDRNFLVSTGLLLVLVVGGLGVQVLLANRSQTVQVAVASTQAAELVRAAGDHARADGERVTFHVVTAPSADVLRREVRTGTVDAGLLGSDDGSWHLVGKDERNSDLRRWVGQSVQEAVLQSNAVAAGTTWAALSRNTGVGYDLLEPAAGTQSYVAAICAAVFAMLFYVAAMVFGTAIANSVVEEKQNRIVEILAAAIPVRQLLVGKVVGTTVLALAQVVLLAGIGAVGLVATGNGDVLAAMSPGLGWFFAFFLLGFAVLACLWGVVGSLATRLEDIQSTSPPMTVLVMAIFLLGVFAKGTLLTVVSFVPLLSTIAMPTRVLDGDAPWWQALLSLALAAAGSWFVIRLADRMYRNTLLQSNQRMAMGQALRRSWRASRG